MNSHPEDTELRDALRAHWHVHPQRNPDFRTSVWARIEASRRSPATWGAWLRLNTLRLASVAAVCVALAGVGGAWLARAEASHTRDQLVQRYLASIDPHARIEVASR
jgi:hypothetical protein